MRQKAAWGRSLATFSRKSVRPSRQLLRQAFPSSLFPLLLCLRKYDSLIQDQARELSYLRQKIREGRGICYLLAQHAKDTVKSFEDLLRSNDIDYYLGQSFREQLAQGGQLTERLASKLSTSKWVPGRGDPLSPAHRPRRLKREPFREGLGWRGRGDNCRNIVVHGTWPLGKKAAFIQRQAGDREMRPEALLMVKSPALSPARCGVQPGCCC